MLGVGEHERAALDVACEARLGHAIQGRNASDGEGLVGLGHGISPLVSLLPYVCNVALFYGVVYIFFWTPPTFFNAVQFRIQLT